MATGIFINYRRQDTIATAGRVHDRLVRAFGRKQIFMDLDHIPAGADFAQHIEAQLRQCAVLFALIGPNWLLVRNEAGVPRLSDPNDFVTTEISMALGSGVKVVPVLVDGAQMPTGEELPEPIRQLAMRNAVELRNTQFSSDMNRLIGIVGQLLNKPTVSTRRKYAAGTAILGGLALLLWAGARLIPQLHGKITAVEDCGLTNAPKLGVNFSGIFSGVIVDGPQTGANVQLELVRNGNSVEGRYLRAGVCGNIVGIVNGARMTFSWDWAGNSGHGVADQRGNSLSGTSGYQNQTSGGGTFILFQSPQGKAG